MIKSLITLGTLASTLVANNANTEAKPAAAPPYSPAQLNSFAEKLNTPAKETVKITKALWKKFLDSDDDFKNIQWKKLNDLKMGTLLRQVLSLGSPKFTYEEKIKIGKEIVSKYSYERFFKWLLLDTSTSKKPDDKEQLKHHGILINKIDNQTFQINGSNIPIIGKSGLSPDWEKNKDVIGVYTLTNQDILDSTLSIIFRSGFDSLLLSLEKRLGEYENGTFTFSELIEVFNTGITDIKTFLYNEGNEFEAENISKINILQSFLNSNFSGSSDEDKYRNILNSNLGLYLFPTKTQSMINAYNTQTPKDQNKALITAIIDKLKKWQKIDSTSLISVLDGRPISSDKIQAMVRPYNFLLKTALRTGKPIQLRIVGNTYSGYALEVREGVSLPNVFRTLDQDETNVQYFYWKLNEFAENEGPVWVRHDAPWIIDGTASKTSTFSWEPLTQEGSSRLKLPPQKVAVSGTAHYYYMSLIQEHQYSGAAERDSHTDSWDGDIKLHENDGDDNDVIRNLKTVTGGGTLITPTANPWEHPAVPLTPYYINQHTWDVKVPFIVTAPINHVNWFRIVPQPTNLGYWNDYGSLGKFHMVFKLSRDATHRDIVSWPSLSKSIILAYNKFAGKVKKDFEANKETGMFGILSSAKKYTYRIGVKSIDFGDIRSTSYNDSGWDDTHSDHFKFDNARVKFEIELTTEEY